MTAPTDTPDPRPSAPLASEPELATLAGLGKATALAVVLAALLLVFVVLPAEFNLDLTGFGGAVGLTRLSAPEDEAEVAPPAAAQSPTEPVKAPVAEVVARAPRQDEVEVEVPAGKGVEYKFSMRAGERMKFSWTAGEDSLFFDFHGEPTGGPKDFFESYTVSTATQSRGTFTAPFDGVHGWYWKNRGAALARVKLTTSGSYEVLGLR